MFGEHFELNEDMIKVINEFGKHMPGGFFIYKAEAPETLLYANEAVLDIFGCENMDEFKKLTGFTFKGMLHPDDYTRVSDSIEDQIEKSHDKNDYVEYRIIRKDGTVRWVDDYGHYTDTNAYGGIYYVFISDITEKREKNAKIAELKGSLDSLLTNMPAMTFSKDVRDGRYVACNQGFADYAHKPSPEGVVGLTDFEIFDPVTAQHFVDDDKKAESMDEPYVFIEDVPDAVGNPRHFQTTKLKYTDDTGRACILGMCVDVTEMARLTTMEVEGRVRGQEKEKRQILQEQLELRDRQSDQQAKMITALAADYKSVYYIELDKNRGICYQAHSDMQDGYQVGEEFEYLKTFTDYADRFVTAAYREEFIRFIQPEAIREGLKTERVISYRYIVSREGVESYEMVKFAGVRHPEDREDHLVHNVGACFTDVDSETRRTLDQSQALSDALAVAEEANKAKTVFLSNMSHEIRTPMNAIIGLNNIALNDPGISEKTEEHLLKMKTSAEHLMNIINDILDMSRIESGRMTIKSEEFSFSKMLEQVNTIINGQCRDKGLHYECRIRGRIDDYYIGDDMKLRQVLINILGNAVKFTPKDGTVNFIVEEAARYDGKATIKFIISDTGIGMSREYLPRLFETFSQEDSSASNKYGSTGLGMPITKSIVELMNGTIDVESEKGKGTTFTVAITFKESDRKAIVEEEGDLHPEEMCVLVIDDDPVACEHAQIVLGQVGIKCETAASGQEGLDMVKVRHARREPYNLLLVDWRMPEMDGVETTRRIRSIVGNETPIIILTSYNWEDIAEEAKVAGVDSFAPKPLFAATVMDEFKEAFRKKNAGLLMEKVDLAGRHILLAEDMEVNAEILIMILNMRDMIVDLAENGKIAVELFSASEEGYYDAILMDMRMPEMDGLTATRLIRAMNRPDARSVPIIALTANAFDEDVQRSMQAGLNAHLSKPVEAENLYKTLEGFMSSSSTGGILHVPDSGCAVAYVDGSYDIETKRYSYGMVFIKDGAEEEFSEAFDNPELATMRNVAGELEGALHAMSLAIERGCDELELYYDYAGIECWCTGAWKTNKDGTKAYKEYYDSISDRLKVKFIKVKGHSGDKYNDRADRLAKRALNL